MLRLLPAVAFAFHATAAPVPKPGAVKPEQFTERRVQMLRASVVQKELGMSAEQRIAAIDHFEAADQAYSSAISGLYPPSGPPLEAPGETERKRKMAIDYAAKRHASSQDALAHTLTGSQMTRLMELERRYLGPFAFRDPEVAGLMLNAEQVAQLDKAMEEFHRQYDENYSPQRKPTSRSLHDDMAGVGQAVVKTFTVEQQRKWAELLGPEPKVAPVGHAVANSVIRAAAERAFAPQKDDNPP